MNWNEEVIRHFYNKGYRVINNQLVDENGSFKKSSIKNGYMCYGTRLYNKNVHLKHHRLLAYELFGEDIFKKGIVVRHINGNRLDNYPENIKIGTTRDNYYDMTPEQINTGINVLIKNSNTICVEINRVFDDNTVLKILEDRKNGYTYKELCKKYNTHRSTLNYFFNKSKYVKSIIQYMGL